MSAETFAELQQKAREVEAAADKLVSLTREYEGHTDGKGEFRPGPKLAYELALEGEIAQIYQAAIDDGKRPPPEDVRQALAHQAVRRRTPDLWGEYQRLTIEITALRRWLSDRKASISARQSVLSAEKATMGVAA